MKSYTNLSILNGSKRPLPNVKYLSRLFEDNAAKYPDTIAVIYKEVSSGTVRQMTFSELDKAANRMARAMLSIVESSPNGDGDSVIAVSMHPSEALVLVLLAIWKCGASQMPLDKHTPSARLQHILKETKPVLIITQDEDSERDVAYDGYKVVSFRRLNAEARKLSATLIRDNEMLRSVRQPLAVILFTSGSVGIPKGVRLPHEVVYNRLRWQWQEFPYSSRETVCVFKTTPIFVDAVSELWAPLLNPEPRSVLIIPKEVTIDPQKLIPLLVEYNVERILVVPSLLRSILLYLGLSQQKQLTNVRTWICSGEPLPVTLATQFFSHFSFDSYRLCNFYGSTEIMGDVTYHVIKSEDDLCVKDKVPIGKPVDNTTIYLLDDQLRPVPVGEAGEICVSGLNVSAGYVNGREPERFAKNPHAADTDHDRLYRTGDYGRIVKDVILYEGRNDSQVKVRGHRVDLAEIEFALNRIKGVKNTTVLCFRQGEVDQEIIAYVTQHEDSNLTGEEIENLSKLSLAICAVPKVLQIDEIPLLDNGKVDRETLKRRYAKIVEEKANSDNVDLDYSIIPDGKLVAAKCLLRTIESVLAGSLRGKISLESNFYNLGGTSLNSVYTVTKLREQGYFIGITDFITAETLLEVLKKIKHGVGKDENETLTLEYLRAHYVTETVVETHKSDVFRILVDSLYLKTHWHKFLDPLPQREDFEELINILFPLAVEKELSFLVRSVKTGDFVGASLNFDLQDDLLLYKFPDRLKVLLDMIINFQEPIMKNNLPQGKGQVLYGYFLATDKILTAVENVAVVYFMESEVINLCKNRGFLGVFTTNANPLTQQLGRDVFKYRILGDFRINTYVAPDGSRPLLRAPDSMRAICSYKEV